MVGIFSVCQAGTVGWFLHALDKYFALLTSLKALYDIFKVGTDLRIISRDHDGSLQGVERY